MELTLASFHKKLLRFYLPLTSLFGCNLTGNTRDIAVQARPAGLTIAAVGGSSLPARSSIFTGSRVTPMNQVLKHIKKTNSAERL